MARIPTTHGPAAVTFDERPIPAVRKGPETQPIDAFTPPPPLRPILVVGMGPAGLVSAIESARKGYQVVILENRTQSTRSQRMTLTRETVDYMTSLVGDEDSERRDILKKVSNDFDTIQVKDLEKFFKLTLEHDPALKHLVHTKQGDGKLLQVEGETRQATWQSNSGGVETIPFAHIVDATGGRGLPIFQNGEALNTNRLPLEVQPRQVSHGTISLQTEPILGLDRPLTHADLAHLRELGWNKAYPPAIYTVSDADNRKHYIGGEIPKRIAQEPDKETQRQLLESWGKKILSLQKAGIGT